MKARVGVLQVKLYTLFNFGARWRGWSAPRPGRFTHGNEWICLSVAEHVWHRRYGPPSIRDKFSNYEPVWNKNNLEDEFHGT